MLGCPKGRPGASPSPPGDRIVSPRGLSPATRSASPRPPSSVWQPLRLRLATLGKALGAQGGARRSGSRQKKLPPRVGGEGGGGGGGGAEGALPPEQFAADLSVPFGRKLQTASAESGGGAPGSWLPPTPGVLGGGEGGRAGQAGSRGGAAPPEAPLLLLLLRSPVQGGLDPPPSPPPPPPPAASLLCLLLRALPGQARLREGLGGLRGRLLSSPDPGGGWGGGPCCVWRRRLQPRSSERRAAFCHAGFLGPGATPLLLGGRGEEGGGGQAPDLAGSSYFGSAAEGRQANGEKGGPPPEPGWRRQS